MGKNGQAGDAFCQASFSLSKDSSQREKKTTVSRIKKRSIIGSSEIWSDKAGLLHRAHRETEKTEGKNYHGGTDGTKERQRCNVLASLYFWDKRHSSFSPTNALVKLSENLRCSTHRRCLRYRVSTSVHSLPLCDISSKSSTHKTNLITPNS